MKPNIKRKIGGWMLIAGLMLVLGAIAFPAESQAEGSRELVKVPAGSPAHFYYRPYISWTPGYNAVAGIEGRTTLHVYAKAGETLYFGSSVSASYDSQDIVATSPLNQVHVLDVLSSGEGLIESIAEETAGPFGVGGYEPLTIAVDADSAGWWTVEFHGPVDPDANPDPGKRGAVNPGGKWVDEAWASGSAQGTNVAAWDVTVSADGLAGIPGRMYANYLPLNVGKNGTSGDLVQITPELFILTADGFQYRIRMNGIDPYGFVFFSNNRGYIDSTNNRTLYRSVPLGQMGTANIAVQNPALPDTETDVTHKIFFNPPSPDLPDDVLQQKPIPIPDSFVFEGEAGDKALVGEGGSFQFTTDSAATYQIIIDADQDGEYEPSQDVVIENVSAADTNTVLWNGKDRDGADVPAGDYTAKITMKGGEYHFPFLDVESAPNGIIVEMLNPPGLFPAGSTINEFTVYYNDTNYTTANGTLVDLDSEGIGSAPDDGSNGVDSSGGAHHFANGDEIAIDTWTYFPGASATVNLTVVNGPTATADSVNTDEDTALAIVLAGTDVETDADQLAYHITSLPAHGTLSGTDDTDRHVTYTPTADYNGPDSFKFTVTDEDGITSDEAAVTVDVKAVNDAPTADNLSAHTDVNGPLVVTLSGSDVETDDPDDLIYSITSGASTPEGTVTVSGRSATYTPAADFAGTYVFKYTVTDTGDGADPAQTSAEATVTIAVGPGNTAPIADGQNVSTDENAAVSIELSGSDQETAADALTYTVTTLPAHGTLSGTDDTDSHVVYTPNAGYYGPDSFAFTVTDTVYNGYSAIVSAPATVNITVDGVNEVPAAHGQTVDTNRNTAVSITLSGSDQETAADALVYTVTTLPAHGALSGTDDTDSHVVYTPTAGYYGPDSFAFTVTDAAYHGKPAAASAAATVNITVRADHDSGSGSEPEPKKEEITANVEAGDFPGGAAISSVTIERTTELDGTVKDEVTFNEEDAQDAVEKLREQGGDTVRIVIPDPAGQVAETNVNVPSSSVHTLADGQTDLEIYTEYARILVPAESLAAFGQELYFRIVPVKEEQQRNEIIQRAKQEEMVRHIVGSNTMRILGVPMTIETNMKSHPVTIILPLRGDLPDDPDERREVLDNLVIFVEHDDGTKELVRGQLANYHGDGEPGVQFEISKFSVFTMIYLEGWEQFIGLVDENGLKDGQTAAEMPAYIFGYEDGTFRPDREITRAEAAALLARNIESPAGDRPLDFTDLGPGHWAYDEIRAAVRGGLMVGYPDGTFRPEERITRAEMASIAFHWEELAAKQGSSFTDTAGHWAHGMIEAAADAGVIAGYPDGTFRPERKLTRAEAVIIMNRLLGRPLMEHPAGQTWSDVPPAHWAFIDIESASNPVAEPERHP